MTRDQLHIAFKIEMDKCANDIAFGGCPAFLPEEIDYWLNLGMYQEISNKFTGFNSTDNAFEDNAKRVSDLEKLVTTERFVSLQKDSVYNCCRAIDFFNLIIIVAMLFW